MAIEPNEFTDDWISTLETENIAPCIPAGRPMRMICFNFSGTMRNLER